MALIFHPDLPRGAEEVMDIVAKAFLLRHGAAVFSSAEITEAGQTECEIAIDKDRCIHFRIIQN